jgi:hypothetical protein
VYIDGANPSFIKSLKLQIDEEADYGKVITRYRSEVNQQHCYLLVSASSE